MPLLNYYLFRAFENCSVLWEWVGLERGRAGGLGGHTGGGEVPSGAQKEPPRSHRNYPKLPAPNSTVFLFLWGHHFVRMYAGGMSDALTFENKITNWSENSAHYLAIMNDSILLRGLIPNSTHAAALA
jgi:hypothetical protein